MWRHLWLAMLCVALAGCGNSSGAPGAKDALGVYEAAFRFNLQKHPKEAEVYLAVDGKDAPAELLDKLRKDWPNLKPVSAAPKDKGHQFYVKNLQWTGQGTATVKAGQWFPTNFGGEGQFGTHHLAYRNGQWIVEKVTDKVTS